MRNLFLFLLPVFLLSSCEKSEKESENNPLLGWYTDLSAVASTDGFERINQAIDNNECIYTTGYSHNYDRYATRDLFFENGRWESYAAYYGTCRYLPKVGCSITVINIINNNTLIQYGYADLWDPDYLMEQDVIVGRVYAGRNIGNLVYRGSGSATYTYSQKSNKIVLSNGNIYTITEDGGLIKDGTSRILNKYDPNKEF